jgi:phage terminase small subunit
MSLTEKQTAFCYAYMEKGNASESYRIAYDAENMSDNAIGVEACRLMAHPNVALKIEELRRMAAERNKITVDDLITELQEAREAALKATNPQSAAAVAATMGKAKLLGMLIDKVDANVTTRSLDPIADDEFLG